MADVSRVPRAADNAYTIPPGDAKRNRVTRGQTASSFSQSNVKASASRMESSQSANPDSSASANA